MASLPKMAYSLIFKGIFVRHVYASLFSRISSQWSYMHPTLSPVPRQSEINVFTCQGRKFVKLFDESVVQ